MKTKRIPLTLLAIGILSIMMIAPIHANYQAVAYGRTDRSGYLPGDSGTLYITVRNTGSQALTVKNITVEYPWWAFITDHWDGNFTATGINQALSQNQNYNTQYTFTLPTDGRAHSGSASITVGTDVPNGPYQFLDASASILVAGATYQPLGLSSSILPVVSIVLLGIAVVMLAFVYMGITRLSKK
jgi:uncharacterized membrane protein